MTSVAGEPPVKKNVTSARRASEAPLAVVVWMVAGVSSKPSVSASPAGRAARVFDLTTTPSVASLAAITWRNLSLARQRGRRARGGGCAETCLVDRVARRAPHLTGPLVPFCAPARSVAPECTSVTLTRGRAALISPACSTGGRREGGG